VLPQRLDVASQTRPFDVRISLSIPIIIEMHPRKQLPDERKQKPTGYQRGSRSLQFWRRGTEAVQQN
jgi:hypothetical protein